MATTTPDDAPELAPPQIGDARAELGARYLHGQGLEIGALHLRMHLPEGASVRYVDRMDVDDLRRHYPELAGADLAPVEIIDDGERLEKIASESVDFIVANHFLEHCQDPIWTLATHLEKLRPGGVLFYAVPDKRFTFDFRRPVTPLAHVIADYDQGPEASRAQHYLEWASLVHEGTGPPSEAQAQAYAAELEAENYSIHFHVWALSDLTTLLLHVRERLGSFELEASQRNGTENIVVLRKHGTAELAASPEPEALAVAPAPLPPAPTPGTTRDRIALASLRMSLDGGSRSAHWSIDPDGARGRGLVQEDSTPITFSVRTGRSLLLRGRVQLLPHDWLGGARAARARVETVDEKGTVRRVWRAELPSASAGGPGAGVSFCCEIAADVTGLRLVIDPPRVRDAGSVARGVWFDPGLIDPAAAPDGAIASPPASDRLPERRPGEPLVSVLLPVHDPPLAMLREAVDSVRNQTHEDWELCLVDDGSRRPEITAALRAYADSDRRILLIRREVAGGISDATNAALELATGSYVALLDHDDRLTPNALSIVAGRIAGDPTLDLLYSDEGILQDGRITARSIKPGWSPESLVSFMYTCHLGVYRRSLVQELGGMRSQFDGCQDYDLVLRIAERTERVAHLPAELYQWRAHAASTAGGDQAKPYAYIAQPRALAEHLARRGVAAEVTLGALPGMHGLRHRLNPALDVAVVCPARTAGELLETARSCAEQDHARIRLAVAAPRDLHPEMRAVLAEAGVDEARALLVADDGEDPARALAAAAGAAHEVGAAHLVLMEQPAAGLSRDWVRLLVGHSAQPGVAAAAAVVLSLDGRVTHAGLALPEGIALPLSYGVEAAGVRSLTLNTSAAGGVLAVSALSYAELGPLDPAWSSLMLPELCLRAGERNLRTVVVPEARLQLNGADRSINDLDALWRMRRRWISRHAGDPHYSPRFRTDRGDFEPLVRL